jgi:serine/threonine protein kinase
MIGRTIGKYRFVSQLGRGATGIVYKAVDETLNREVAIKILNPDLANPEILRRFRAEATTLAQLNHPGIATIFELVPADTDLLMVMEFVRGETLESLSRRAGVLEPEHAVAVVEKILSALAYAHRAGIIHRDIKPANVMVTEAGDVKIMDFGIARVRGAEHLTMDGAVIGTPAYMSPEQVLGQDVDERADLYAVAVVLYRLLTGTLPFKGDTAFEMLQRQLADAPTPVSDHRHDLPAWCEPVLQRALAKSPADRFQSADEFREALDGRVIATAPASHARVSSNARSTVASVLLSRRSFIAGGASLLAAVAVLVMVRDPVTESIAAETLPPITFSAKTLVDAGGRTRERDAHVVLADGAITVTGDDGAVEPLHALGYEEVVSITYSRGRDPMWNSPEGPRMVKKVSSGTLAKLGIFVERHWVSLQTAHDTFVVLRFSDELVTKALEALEERTGRTPERVR